MHSFTTENIRQGSHLSLRPDQLSRKLRVVKKDSKDPEWIQSSIVRPANRDWACQTERCHTLSNKTSL